MGRHFVSLMVSIFFITIIVGIHLFVYRLLVVNDMFSIKKIIIKGNKYIPTEEILHLTGLREGMGIFDFSWDVVIPRLTNRSYIRSAKGKRILPWVVNIEVEENLPVGIVMMGTNAFFVDQDGKLYTASRVPQIPRLEVTYPVMVENGRVTDEWLLAVVKHLGKLSHLERVERILLDKRTGAHVWLRTLPTDIWIGHEVLDAEVWQRIFALEKEIIEKKLTVKMINLYRENAIGYK